jgi:hypothetical protein
MWFRLLPVDGQTGGQLLITGGYTQNPVVSVIAICRQLSRSVTRELQLRNYLSSGVALHCFVSLNRANGLASPLITLSSRFSQVLVLGS